MITRNIALGFLNDLLWSMMGIEECQANHTCDQCVGIILDIEPWIGNNKVLAIKELRDWVNNRESVILPNNLGYVLKTALQGLDTTVLFSDPPKVVFQDSKGFGQKEAKDFVDVMEAVLKKTEPKAF